jgi:hypothetical protein
MRTPIAIQVFRLSVIDFLLSSEGSFIDEDAAEPEFFACGGTHLSAACCAAVARPNPTSARQRVGIARARTDCRPA